MFKRPNKPKFDKYKRCISCGATGVHLKRITRKYTAQISETEANVFHYGTNSCEAKIYSSVVIDSVSEAIGIIYPANHQQSKEMLFYLQWEKGNPGKTPEKLQKSISNEKHKQNLLLLPHLNSFSAVIEYKKYYDESSSLLAYSVNENGKMVFKTSTLKMKIEKKKWIAVVITIYERNIMQWWRYWEYLVFLEKIPESL